MKTSKKSGLTVKTSLKAGLVCSNHNRTLQKKSGLAVKTSLKAGLVCSNHSRALLG